MKITARISVTVLWMGMPRVSNHRRECQQCIVTRAHAKRCQRWVPKHTPKYERKQKSKIFRDQNGRETNKSLRNFNNLGTLTILILKLSFDGGSEWHSVRECRRTELGLGFCVSEHKQSTWGKKNVRKGSPNARYVVAHHCIVHCTLYSHSSPVTSIFHMHEAWSTQCGGCTAHSHISDEDEKRGKKKLWICVAFVVATTPHAYEISVAWNEKNEEEEDEWYK